MNTEVLPPDSSAFASGREPLPALNLVVLFADADTDRHANELTRRLEGRLGPKRALHCARWPFHGLNDASLRAAEEADLLMVAIHAAQNLPGAVRDWLDQVLVRGARGRVLVALLEGSPPGADTTSAAILQLRAIALRAGIVFIAHWIDRPGSKDAFLDEALDVRRPGGMQAANDVLPLPQSMPRWGINE